MAPVVGALRAREGFDVIVCATAQHRRMLDQVLEVFGIVPEHDLNLMKPGQSLEALTAAALEAVSRVVEREKPDCVLVQGDTTTTFTSALAAFYRRVPVAHVEAGLRTYRRYEPFPEEMNRRMSSCLSTWHFAPTQKASRALLAEGYPAEDIFTVGNTVVDALLTAVEKTRTQDAALRGGFPGVDFRKPVVLVTGHRRESFGAGFQGICRALLRFARSRPDVEIVYPVHLNPEVQRPVRGLLSATPNIHLLEPLDYLSFLWLLDNSKMVLTDSGGVQEEAPALGKPVLVMRETTERSEAVEAGCALLVGTDEERICAGLERLFNDEKEFLAMSRAGNPFGDGRASPRIAEILEKELS